MSAARGAKLAAAGVVGFAAFGLAGTVDLQAERVVTPASTVVRTPDTTTATHIRAARDPGCLEDQVAVVTHDDGRPPDLDWVCVALDDFADDASIIRLDALLSEG